MKQPTYRNSFEARCARELGPEFQYEALKLPYVLECSYLPDFVDVANKRIVEAKGLLDAADRRKLLAVKRQHPGWTIELWMTNPDRTISKSSRTTYRARAEKNGIVCRQGPKR